MGRIGPSLSAHQAQTRCKHLPVGHREEDKASSAEARTNHTQHPHCLSDLSPDFRKGRGRHKGQREPGKAQEKAEAAQPSRLSSVQPPPGWASRPGTSVLCHHPGGRRSPLSQQARWACSGQLQPSASTSQPQGAQLEVSPEAGDGAGGKVRAESC